MKTITFKLPKIKDVEFALECMSEDIPFEGNASAIDEETDSQNENYIREQLENGNEWAWCTVKVTASYKGQEGTAYLGGCSYSGREEFEKDLYFADLKNEAFADLIQQLENLAD